MAGKPVHIEIAGGDTGRARTFWSGLFGWQWQDYSGPVEYHMTQIVPDETGGAIYAAEGDKRGLRVYFDVDDINAGAAKVRELGGEAGEAHAGSGHGLVRLLHGHRGQRVRHLADRPRGADAGDVGVRPRV